MDTYIVRRYYYAETFDGYDENGILPYVEVCYTSYEDAKQAYASALRCYSDCQSIELILRSPSRYDFTMASSTHSDPRRILLGEDYISDGE